MDIITHIMSDVPYQWGIIEYAAAFSPFVLGSLFFMAKFGYVATLGHRVHPLYNPWPMRIWFGIAAYVALLGLSGAESAWILGGWLLIFLIPIINHDFGEIFT